MSDSIAYLLDVMRKLRNPVGGCPWDIKQDFKSLLPCLLEETYEVIETVESDDFPHLCEELGDLLLQIVFYAQMAEERGLFTFDDVVRLEADKMIERHPHVFGDREGVDTAEDVIRNWEADKAAKRSEASEEQDRVSSALDGISAALPAITRAQKLQKRAARVGFDWKEPGPFVAKIREELSEVEAEVAKDVSREHLEGEIGDLLFAVVGLASHLGLDPERGLRATNKKFEHRFRFVEQQLEKLGKNISESSLPEMEAHWEKAKS